MKETKKPVVSVIMPVYNMEAWLEGSLGSVVSQSLRDIEIICVDDGSADRSPDILQKAAETDSRIRIIRQQNSGLSEARNTGVRAASGKYLYFMDSDDLLDPNALEICSANMERRDLEYLCFNAVAFGDDLENAKAAGAFNLSYLKRTLDDEKIYTGQELFAELKKKDIYTAPVWSCMLLRDAFLEHNLWFHPGILHEDEPWTFTVLMLLLRCGCLNRILYRYRIRNNSITQEKMSFRRCYGIFSGLQDAKRLLAENPELLREPEFRDAEIGHLLRLQRNAVRKYRNCTEEEQLKRLSLEPEERILFEQTVVYPAALAEKTDRQKQVNRELRNRCTELEEQCGVLKKEKQKLQKKIKQSKESASGRSGRMAASVPGKAKELLRRILRRKTDKPAGPGVKPADHPALKTDNHPGFSEPRVIRDGEMMNTVWLLGTPDHKNLGDQSILEGEIAFLNTVFPGKTVNEVSTSELAKKNYAGIKKIAPSATVFLHGGGNLGTIWPDQEKIRRELIHRLKGRRMIVFPQSIWFSEDEAGRKSLAEAKEIYRGDQILLCCRDKVSQRFAEEHFGCRSILVPDMVLWESKQNRYSAERFGAMTLFRSDRERKISEDDVAHIESVLAERFQSIEVSDTVLKSGKVTKQNRKEILDNILLQISSAECVVTDRLHGMILSAVTGTPCVVLGNNNPKVEAGFEWLKPLGYIRFIHETEELAAAIEEVCSCTNRIYPEQEMRKYYGELIHCIQ